MSTSINKEKISLWSAVLININISLGTGIFINTFLLPKYAGILGSLSYLIVGLLMFPLIFSMAQLIKIYPSGGFYTFGKEEITPIAGFISCWSYFTGKLASCTLMIHVSMLILQTMFQFLNRFNILFMDVIVILTFMFLNFLNIKTGTKIQIALFCLKVIPIVFVIISGLYLFSGSSTSSEFFLWNGIVTTIPFILYTFTGFEATCSLSRKIENSKINGPKAIIISHLIVITIVALYQLMFFAGLGNLIVTSGGYLESFNELINKIFLKNPLLVSKLKGVLFAAIASSALGGAYGIMFSNNWNLYTLAENKHLFFYNILKKLNRHNIPFLCVLTQTFICMLYLLTTKGNQISLQQISSLGCTISYTISMIALSLSRKNVQYKIVSNFALAICLFLISICLRSFYNHGIFSLVIFLSILLTGISMFALTKKRSVT